MAQADIEYVDKNLLYTPMSVQVWPTQIFQGRRGMKTCGPFTVRRDVK
jgi:hypothetical protein